MAADVSKEKIALIQEEARLVSIYSWEAPERVYEPKDRKWYVTVASIAMIIIVLSALTNNIGLIFVIATIMLLIYALNTIPPQIVTHELTDKGIKTHGAFYQYTSINKFWVTKRGDNTLIHIEIIPKENSRFFDEMILLQGKGDIKMIVSYMVQFVDYVGPKEINTNFILQLVNGKYIPLLNFLDNSLGVRTKDPNDSPSIATEVSQKPKAK